jgi:DNA-binding winged helix-turn-helix (wHTH) protein
MAHTTDQHCLVSRSFLVHLRTDADIPGGRVVGRVEHVPSGDAAHFQSIDELLSFMAALLDATKMHERSHLPTDEPPLVFGPFRLEIADATLWHGSQSLPLTPKAFSVLQCLVQRRGRLVTKDELYNAVWPGVFVGDAVLKVCVLEIRRVLADDAKAPRYIETVHRRGYRFIAPVTEAPESRPAAAAAPAVSIRFSRRRPITPGAATSTSRIRWSATARSIWCS